MPIWENNNFTNNVINQTASKSHNLYIMSLHEQNNDIYKQGGLTYGSSVNIKEGKQRRTYPAYLWDLYDLAKSMNVSLAREENVNSSTNDISNILNHYRLTENMAWKTLFVDKFTDNSGSDIYQSLTNFIPLAVNNFPKFISHTYQGNFSFSPLINIRLDDIIQNVISVNGNLPTQFRGLSQLINDQAAAELIMYFVAKIPLFPFFVCSSINSHYSFGPVFMSSMNFSVGGEGGLGIVDITCQFIGGKILVSPEIDLFVKKRPGIEPIVFNEMKDFSNNTKTENATNLLNTNLDYDFHRYRSASLLDVIVIDEYIPNFSDLIARVAKDQAGLKFTKSIPEKKIISVKLDITQNIDLIHTVPSINNIQFPDSIGPKYATLKDRTVSGSITYFGYTDRMYNNINKGLTIYFGGPFFFAMKNVDWSNPIITITPEDGYTHTYNFKARLPDQVENNILVEFPFNKNPDEVYNSNVSEFSYNNYSYDEKNFIEDYIESFKKVILSELGIRSIK